MQWALVASLAAQCTLKLKLVNARKEIAHIGHIGGHVKLGTGIEIRFCPRHRWSDSLILQPQCPPFGVVLFRLNLAGENFPAPLVDGQSERQECHFFKRLL